MPKFSNALFRELKRAYQDGENLVPMSKRTGISTSELSIGLRMAGCKMRARGRAKSQARKALARATPNESSSATAKAGAAHARRDGKVVGA